MGLSPFKIIFHYNLYGLNIMICDKYWYNSIVHIMIKPFMRTNSKLLRSKYFYHITRKTFIRLTTSAISTLASLLPKILLLLLFENSVGCGKVERTDACSTNGDGDSFRFLPGTMPSWKHLYYRQFSNISCTQPQNINVSHLVMLLSLPNPLKPGVRLKMKI